MTPEEILTADLETLGMFIASRLPFFPFSALGKQCCAMSVIDRVIGQIIPDTEVRGMFSPEELAALIRRIDSSPRRRVAWGVWGLAYGEKPDFETLEGWEEEGGAEAVDGCWVEPDGVCEHGAPSWLLVLGLI